MKTVLILEDDTPVRESFTGYFEDRDWRVIPVTSAEEALEILDGQSPDCAVVDIRLPGMDGNAFITAALSKLPKLACVIATGSPEYLPPDSLVEKVGVSSNVFTKPINELADLEKELLKQMEICKNL